MKRSIFSNQILTNRNDLTVESPSKFLSFNKTLKLFAAMKSYKPTDATTNPSLILSAAGMKQYQHIIDKAVKHGIESGT